MCPRKRGSCPPATLWCWSTELLHRRRVGGLAVVRVLVVDPGPDVLDCDPLPLPGLDVQGDDVTNVASRGVVVEGSVVRQAAVLEALVRRRPGQVGAATVARD